MAEVDISDLTSLSSGDVDRATDVLEIQDITANQSKKITPNALMGISGAAVGTTDSQSLTNKTVTAPNISDPVLSGTLTGTYTIGGTPTFPSSVVTLTGSQTLTNKVLTSPTINTATISNPTLTVDSISEYTSAAGVTIDGLNIKDGALNTNNSVPNTAWNNTGSFGSSWVWTSFTPTFTFLSGGTLNVARYSQVGKIVNFYWKYTLAGAGVTGLVTFTLPVTASANMPANTALNFVVRYDDTGTNGYMGFCDLTSATVARMLISSVAGTYPTVNGIAPTVPHTWAATDVLSVYGTYEAA